LRTALTLIGIVVGVTAVISVVTIIKGLDQTVANTFNSQGSTVFTISKRPRVITSREDFIKYNKRKDLTEEDADAIVRLCTLCWRIGIVANDAVNTKHGNQKNENVQMRAINPSSTFDIDGVSLDAVVTGATPKATTRTKSPWSAPTSSRIHFRVISRSGRRPADLGGRQAVQILGVLTPLGKILGASRDNIIYVPFATYKKNFGVNVKRGAFSAASVVVLVQTQSAQQLEATEDQVRAIMRNRRGKTFSDDDDGFALETQDVFLNLYSAATSNIYL
jgi:putative ABC transport system permease protein